MDPFLGLGSTAVAAAELGVDFVGIEIDEHYLKEAVQRVKKALDAETVGRRGSTRTPVTSLLRMAGTIRAVLRYFSVFFRHRRYFLPIRGVFARILTRGGGIRRCTGN